jgi:hypothetical protein
MKKLALILAALGILALAVACGDDNGDSPSTVTPAGSTPGPQSTTPEPTQVPDVCAPNPDPATPDLVQIDAPEAFARLSPPVIVSGKIAAFEATFKIRIFDAAGGIAGGVTAMSAEGQVLSDFSEEVDFAVVEETAGCIWVFEESARDGSPIHIAQIPVVLLPQG